MDGVSIDLRRALAVPIAGRRLGLGTAQFDGAGVAPGESPSRDDPRNRDCGARLELRQTGTKDGLGGGAQFVERLGTADAPRHRCQSR